MNKISTLVLAFALAAPCARATTVHIHYDTGADHKIFVRTDKGPASWDKGAAATNSSAGTWTYNWPDELGDIQMKPALDDKQVSGGGVYRIAKGATSEIYPFFGAPFGKVIITEAIASPQLGNERKLRVYLPPSYQENSAKRYPVLYMHDGQNLFDAKTAAYGVEWGIAKTANRLIATGLMDEIIVVGIDNSPDRIAEYTPCCDPKYGGGKLEDYRAFLVDTVKPYAEAHWRTMAGKENTAIMGSSLGGIASLLIAQRHPDLFSKVGAMSSSFWWNGHNMATHPAPHLPLKLYVDAGTVNDELDDTRRMRDVLLKQGYNVGNDLLYAEGTGHTHNETAWAARVEAPLRWFFGWGSTLY
jgi:predicted alpha/beta superfamily hydrolase